MTRIALATVSTRPPLLQSPDDALLDGLEAVVWAQTVMAVAMIVLVVVAIIGAIGVLVLARRAAREAAVARHDLLVRLDRLVDRAEAIAASVATTARALRGESMEPPSPDVRRRGSDTTAEDGDA